MKRAMWYVYILRCADGTLYTGSTTDVEKRVKTHNSGKGARYTRSRLPVEVVYRESAADRSEALRREAAIKTLSRAEKLRLIESREGQTVEEMRRKDRALTAQEAWEVVERCGCGVLTMTAADGTPYGVPVNYARGGDAIWFHCAMEGKKTEALRKDSRVCLVCVEHNDVVEEKYTTKYASAMVFGKAEEVTDETEKLEGLRWICRRHTPGNMAMFDEYAAPRTLRTAVWKVSVESLSGKSNR